MPEWEIKLSKILKEIKLNREQYCENLQKLQREVRLNKENLSLVEKLHKELQVSFPNTAHHIAQKGAGLMLIAIGLRILFFQ